MSAHAINQLSVERRGVGDDEHRIEKWLRAPFEAGARSRCVRMAAVYWSWTFIASVMLDTD